MAGLISERLKNLGFMKRREEHDIRTRLAARAKAASTESKTKKTSLSEKKPGEKVVPLVVVENAAEIGDGGDDVGRSSGRRSFGNFNPKLEAVIQRRREGVIVGESEKSEVEEDGMTMEEVANWRRNNVEKGGIMKRSLSSMETTSVEESKKDPLRGTKRKAIRKTDRKKKKKRRKMDASNEKDVKKKNVGFMKPEV